MQSSDEAQPRSFSRSRVKKLSWSPTEGFVKMTPDGLRTPRNLAEAIERSGIPDTSLEMQQPGAFHHPTPSFSSHHSNVANATGIEAVWLDGPTASSPSVTNSLINNNTIGMNSTAQYPSMGIPGMHNAAMLGISVSGNGHQYSGVNGMYPQQIPYGSQPQQTFNQGLQTAMPSQQSLVFGTGSHEYGPPQQEAGTHSISLLHHNHNNPVNTHYPTPSQVASGNQAVSLNNPASWATVDASDYLVAIHGNSRPTWMAPPKHSVPACQPQLNEGVINLSTPPKDSSQVEREAHSPSRAAFEQPKGPQMQIDVIGTPSPDCSPKENVNSQAVRYMRDAQSLVFMTTARRCPSPSIDVDNEDHESYRGRNRPVHEEAIDLSDDTNKEPNRKDKKDEGQKSTTLPKKPYKIPLKTKKGDAPSPSVFKDPLRENHRKPSGPPPSPFSRQLDVVLSPRRSPRFRGISRGENSVMSPTNSRDRTLPENSPVDCQLPLGGIAKEKREKRSDGNSYMHSNRSTDRRRRPKCANDTNLVLSGSHNLPDKQRRTRRKRKDEKGKSRKKKPSSCDVKRAPDVAEVVDDDSDNGFSNAMRQRKPVDLDGQDIQEEDPEDSPLSNTVGDGSNSDDDDIGAGGNELSSDDDTASPPKQSQELRKRRKRRGNTGKRSQPGGESPRTPRRETARPTNVDTLNDSDDSCFMEVGSKPMNKTSKEGKVSKSKRRNTREEVMKPQSPVNLISPSTSRPKQEPIRRSPRKIKRRITEEQVIDAAHTDGSDEDFDNSHMKMRFGSKTDKLDNPSGSITRSGRKRLCSSKEDDNAERKPKKTRRKTTNVECGASDGETESSHGSHGEEDSDTAGEFLSQEAGSQPLEINVKCVKKRKKTNLKEYPEKEFKKMSPDELAIIRVAFIKRYPAPPSNMQAQGRYEAAHGIEMTAGMVQKTWETQLKPWSDRWWKLYLDFNQVAREKKLGKPRSKDPTIKEREVKAWVEEYYQKHGDAKPTPQISIVSEKAQ